MSHSAPRPLPCGPAPVDVVSDKGGCCVLHLRDPALPKTSHRTRTVAALAARLAAFVGAPRTGRPARDCPQQAIYFVPDTTLVASAAADIGITDEDDLYGGVVPERVVAGKSITHPLAGHDSLKPAGWSGAFSEAVRAHTLRGISAFTAEDVRTAVLSLLARGPVRLKPAWADGGRGQTVVRDGSEIAPALDELDLERLGTSGLVIEENLADTVTFSVGRLRVGGHALAYVGTQTTTIDNEGQATYGGSRLYAVKGGFPHLAQTSLSAGLREALRHASAYDAAADSHFPGFFASRRNYDVVLGRDGHGTTRAGVLEQSWRIGGASGAEIAALNAFANDARLTAVVASCREVYGPAADPPNDCDVYYHADTPEVGYLTKYALIEACSHAQ